jgi:tetratricopeptide (TPR) repeat protein
MRVFVILLFGGLLCSTAVARADDQPVTIHMDNEQMILPGGFASDPKGAIMAARQRIAAGDLGGAIKYLSTYVASHPDEIEPKRFLGDLYFRNRELGLAELEYIEILRAVPGDKETHNRLGTVYAVENRVDEAISQFNAALPGTDSVADLVDVHRRKGDLDKYEREMQHLAQEYPNQADLQAELGQVYAAVHQPYEASMYFQRALDDDQHSLTALNGLGLAYLSMRNYSDAEREFRTCLSEDETAYQCENNLGAAELEAGQYDDAKSTLDRAFHLGPEHAETLINYGYLDDTRGNWNEAVAEYAKAIALDPYLPEAYVNLALDYEARDMNSLAEALLLKGLASNGTDGRLHYLLGRAYEAQGETKLAIAAYKAAAASSDPDVARIAQQQVAAITNSAPKQ